MSSDFNEALRQAAEECMARIRNECPEPEDDNEVEEFLQDRFNAWEKSTASDIEGKSPYKLERLAIDNARNSLSYENLTEESLANEIEDIRSFGNQIDGDKWRNRGHGLDADGLARVKKELDDLWEKLYQEKQRRWVNKYVTESLDDLEDEISEFLEETESLRSVLRVVGPGLSYDYSLGHLSGYNTDLINQWTSYVENDRQIKEICEMLGRMTSRSTSKTVKVLKPVSSKTTLPDINSREEFSGIEMGNRIEDLLPSELGLLNSPESELLFDLKYVENRLLCFTKQGYVSTDKERMEEVDEVKKEMIRGPIIFCIDTSSSMMGTPEAVAKAVTLYMSKLALSEGRRCYLINFSTGIETTDITPPRGISELIDFLGRSFHGGTDPMPALEHAVELTRTRAYGKADVIMISDFNMAIPDDMRTKMALARRRKCRFHSLIIGNDSETAVTDAFDYNWRYSPFRDNISDIRTFGSIANN